MAYIQSRSSPSYRLEGIAVALPWYLQFSNKGQIVPFIFCTKLKVVFFYKWQPTFSNGSIDAIWAAVNARRDLPCLWIPGCRSAGPPPQCSPSSDSCVDDSSNQLFTPEIHRRLPGTKAVLSVKVRGQNCCLMPCLACLCALLCASSALVGLFPSRKLWSLTLRCSYRLPQHIMVHFIQSENKKTPEAVTSEFGWFL